MKTTGKISLLLNLALIGALICVWKSSRGPGANSAPPASPTPQTWAQTAPHKTAAAVVRQVVEARPFRWDQLMSTNGDYRDFVANLRAAGCPEAVVEDIVRGDAQRAFYAKRVELGVDGTAPGPWSVRSQLETVTYVLGQTPTDSARPKPNVAGRDQPPAGSATLAAFLQNTELTGEGANEEEKRQIANLRHSLLTQISLANQPPNSSSYPVVQSGTVGTQLAQSAANNSTQPPPSGMKSASARWRPQPNQSLLQAAEAESTLGGLFGMGAVMQYEQYSIMQSGKQPPQN